MNYRHAFHAGNFADCMKHALMLWLLQAMLRKPSPICVLDTHAGAGAYDLDADPARRTGEAEQGIRRLLKDTPADLAGYVALVRRLGLYPGSPALIRAMLRPDDRLVCCELHEEDAATLRRRFARDPLVSVHRRDAWEAMRALLPPTQKRGLVLIDPPYEDPLEFDRLAHALATGYGRFRNGVFAAWYPIKHRTPVRSFLEQVRATAIRDVVTAELLLREPLDPARLNGCGLLVVNPPYRFETEAMPILRALLGRLGGGEAGAGAIMARVIDE
ncbi:MAG: 23S rRNA (adenine(2030)-N(6))-methyltransferase RlmJ [Acetobacteraceae bacterium]